MPLSVLIFLAQATPRNDGGGAFGDVPLGSLLVTALGAAVVTAVASHLRQRAQNEAEGQRLDKTLKGENERLASQLTEEKERLERQLVAEQERLDAQLAAERDRLQLQLDNARVDELRSVLENAALAFLQAANALGLVLHGDPRPLDAQTHLEQLQANEARIAVRLGNESAITQTYSEAAKRWAEAVTLAATPAPGEDATGLQRRKEAIAAAFNDGHVLSKRFNDHAAALLGVQSHRTT